MLTRLPLCSAPGGAEVRLSLTSALNVESHKGRLYYFNDSPPTLEAAKQVQAAVQGIVAVQTVRSRDSDDGVVDTSDAIHGARVTIVYTARRKADADQVASILRSRGAEVGFLLTTNINNEAQKGTSTTSTTDRSWKRPS